MGNPNYQQYQNQNQPQAQPSVDYDYDDGGVGGEASTYGEKEQELLRIQIDVEGVLKSFEYEVLRGMVEMLDKNTGEKKWVPIAPKYKPPMNELGVREMMARMRGRVTTVARLTYKNEKEVYTDMFHVDMSMTELIAKRSDKWELDIEIAKSIKDAALEIIFDVLCSSRNGFTAINLRSQYQRSDVTRTDMTEKSSGRSFLGIPLGGKR